MSGNKVTLVGAGLAGSLLSVYLARRGLQVDIYERRPDMRATKISAGRSINLALSVRGLHALEQVGLKDRIMEIAIPMRGRMIHSLDGEQTFIPYGSRKSEVINSVSRAELNKLLMRAAEAKGVRIQFGQKCTGCDFRTGNLNLHDEAANEDLTKQVAVVIGTDGSASAIREGMVKSQGVEFSKADLQHAYKELTIPAGSQGEFRLEKSALHIWPRRDFMLIALPNLDGSFTCTLFLPVSGATSFETLQGPEPLKAFFQAQFPDALPLMPTLVEDFFSNPIGALATIRCQRWYVDGKACLLGDAAHAIVPFFGQGINCGFEDCAVLDECVGLYEHNWQTIFAEFEKRRKVNSDAIAQLSLENYFVMRDLVADPTFSLRKQVEFALEEKFPDKFIPKYSMVSFHRLPYSEALEKGAKQDLILDELCESITSVDEIDWTRAGALIDKNRSVKSSIKNGG